MAHQFADIYEAPESLRHISYTPITVKQLNTILLRADVVGLGGAKQEFREQNEIVDGQWVPAKTEAKA